MNLKRFAWSMLAYSIAVIVWGAYVRHTGSGAGCGDHWPLCDGQVIPQAPQVETVIEFTHRVSSGLALLGVLALWLLTRRRVPAGHPARKNALWAAIFMLIEAAIGAGLVLLRLVGQDTSAARAVVIALHLVNTMLLLGSLTLAAWALPSEKREGAPGMRTSAGFTRLSWIGLALFLVAAASGAVTALGDTLFPPGAPGEALRQATEPGQHFLVNLRIYHPFVSALLAAALLLFAYQAWKGAFAGESGRRVRRLALALAGLTALQCLLGAAGILLLVPTWMALSHLGMSDLLWVCFVLTWAQARPLA